MTLLEAYDHLEAEISQRVDLPIYDNLNLRQPELPCIAVVPEATPLSLYGGGSMPTGKQVYSIFILQPLKESYREARQRLWDAMQQLTDIPRFYVEEETGWEYGEDIVGRNPKQECVLASIKGTVA